MRAIWMLTRELDRVFVEQPSRHEVFDQLFAQHDVADAAYGVWSLLFCHRHPNYQNLLIFARMVLHSTSGSYRGALVLVCGPHTHLRHHSAMEALLYLHLARHLVGHPNAIAESSLAE